MLTIGELLKGFNEKKLLSVYLNDYLVYDGYSDKVDPINFNFIIKDLKVKGKVLILNLVNMK